MLRVGCDQAVGAAADHAPGYISELACGKQALYRHFYNLLIFSTAVKKP
jgi:hypothetical protein